ncbi:hypothetical protein A3C28_03385 [Candidatus Roizmanbacteria bacterium RIFCSPHIGHO2_02_FULL_39_9]|uniref:Transcobalamin-like C-terminal domain-containing protein n=2 Tax=Candidatus Roizmaniibacteriota TaxID=1752723 RepID=A0A1F7I2W4_9BACT|nr:MAG: hypothetical protein A3C28_03385 [Candidatus Roizmanbacteria bacterium RIFCSPHIGHO2_02_FULL_39_9]OGK37697.1 MAG: hypothetical protein A3F60_02005 [Candidatus Roizmanbacteria bacterium RIFCSPHIGHO2_12_FULL_39_8]
MKKWLLIILLILCALLLLEKNLPYQKKTETVSPTKIIKKITVQQKIVGENFKRSEIGEGKTALDLLQQTSKVKTKGEKENAYVIEIDGKKADDAKKEFWSLYINGTIAPVGAGSYVLKNGDSIEWKIETY